MEQEGERAGRRGDAQRERKIRYVSTTGSLPRGGQEGTSPSGSLKDHAS